MACAYHVFALGVAKWNPTRQPDLCLIGVKQVWIWTKQIQVGSTCLIHLDIQVRFRF